MSIKLIAALGNQEPAYTNTRHNVGFAWINQLALAHRGTWQPNKNKEGLVCRLQHNAETVILFKPGKLMNINGKPLPECAQYYKIAPAEMLLCYDDLDLEVGTIKLKQSTGHGGHNGVRNLPVS